MLRAALIKVICVQDCFDHPSPRPVSRLATLVLTAVIVLLMATGGAFAQSVVPPGNAVNTDQTAGPAAPRGTESASDFWRAFRGGDPNDLLRVLPDGRAMTTTGQYWRAFREDYITVRVLWLPAIVLILLALHQLLRGPMRISAGRSGKTIPRFTLSARVAHWFTAVVFIFLGLSGLTILMARPVLVPLLGNDISSVLVSAALQGHNVFGPLFILALVWLFIKFIRGNFFQIVDFKWIFKLGGLFGGHVSSSQFNFGEKSWFWMVILLGSVMSVTGLALEFPWLIGDLRLLQASTILHGVGAVALITVSLGHIYVGTIGMEGAIDSMLKGEVDENWAKEHHDLWYEEMTGKSASDPAEETP